VAHLAPHDRAGGHRLRRARSRRGHRPERARARLYADLSSWQRLVARGGHGQRLCVAELSGLAAIPDMATARSATPANRQVAAVEAPSQAGAYQPLAAPTLAPPLPPPPEPQLLSVPAPTPWDSEVMRKAERVDERRAWLPPGSVRPPSLFLAQGLSTTAALSYRYQVSKANSRIQCRRYHDRSRADRTLQRGSGGRGYRGSPDPAGAVECRRRDREGAVAVKEPAECQMLQDCFATIVQAEAQPADQPNDRPLKRSAPR
jgi:hypothetical protein